MRRRSHVPDLFVRYGDGRAAVIDCRPADRADEWVVAVWQNRPHESLTHLWGQGAAVSPNDAYAAMVARCGYVPVPRSTADYVELLPVGMAADQRGRHHLRQPRLRQRRAQPVPAHRFRGAKPRRTVGSSLRPLRRHRDLGA